MTVEPGKLGSAAGPTGSVGKCKAGTGMREMCLRRGHGFLFNWVREGPMQSLSFRGEGEDPWWAHVALLEHII